ncbi:hypothetical protein DFS34DRAFT_638918 [Phlyctochytrium arcticum]|nr:hypothetical protein DFS34DRAFT_638918 [Phlyctochytrium arcticum]
MGNLYVKDEFRRHATPESTPFLPGFLREWVIYRDDLAHQLGVKVPEISDAGAIVSVLELARGPKGSIDRGGEKGSLGRRLSEEELEAMNDQQVGQLHALREAALGHEDGPDGHKDSGVPGGSDNGHGSAGGTPAAGGFGGIGGQGQSVGPPPGSRPIQ